MCLRPDEQPSSSKEENPSSKNNIPDVSDKNIGQDEYLPIHRTSETDEADGDSSELFSSENGEHDSTSLQGSDVSEESYEHREFVLALE